MREHSECSIEFECPRAVAVRTAMALNGMGGLDGRDLSAAPNNIPNIPHI